jgi:PAS domain S-box-containing protein
MTQDPPHIGSIATQKLLEGLARLHPFVLATDREGRIGWMSPTLRAQLYREPSIANLAAAGDENLVGEVIAHLPKQDQLDALRHALQSKGRARALHLEIGTPNGSQICVEASAFAVDSEGPDGPHYVVIARPLPEKERSERKLEESLELLSQLVGSSPNGVFATDRLGYISYANPSAARLLGRPGEDLTGSPAAVFLPQSSGFEDLLSKLRNPLGWEGEEIERVDALGQPTWVSVSTRPLLDADGGPLGVIVYLQDITRRHQVQLELERKNLELESYVDSVAHDLRSPLVSLLGFTRLIKQDYENALDETAHRFLDRIERAGVTMDALIHDLLELSRICRPGDVRAAIDPRSVLLQVESELKLRLEESAVTLLLPESPPMMRVDGTRLYQVFSNLVGNALEHGFVPERPQSDARVSVEIHEEGLAHRVTVSDNGCGIAPQDHERIFEISQTGRGVRRSERSHGIGLAIVKKIAEAHAGKVWVESEPGHGSHFHVLFPNT